MWTPLHQAAYMGASTNVVKRLLALGASRKSFLYGAKYAKLYVE